MGSSGVKTQAKLIQYFDFTSRWRRALCQAEEKSPFFELSLPKKLITCTQVVKVAEFFNDLKIKN